MIFLFLCVFIGFMFGIAFCFYIDNTLFGVFDDIEEMLFIEDDDEL